MRRSAISLIALMSAGFLNTGAFAQSQANSSDSGGHPLSGTVAQQAKPIYARASGSLFSPANLPPNRPLTGPLSTTGNWLEQHGIDFRLPFTEQLMNNVSEGSHPGITASGSWVQPTLTLDMHKILGIPGARMRFQDEVRFLKLNDGPNANGIQAGMDSYALGNQHRLTKVPNTMTELTWDQLLLDDRLELELGRVNIKRYFFTANCDVNQLSCYIGPIGANTSLGPPAYSEWAGRGAWNITRDTYVQVATEEVDPHGKNTRGFDFGIGQATGYATMADLAYKTGFSSTAYPAYFDFGGYSVHAPHNDPTNSKHVINTTSGIGLTGQKTVWRADDGKSRAAAVPHLNLYFQTFAGLDPTNVYNGQVTAGLSYFGLIPSRPLDIIGAKVTFLQITSHEQQFLASQRALAGGPNSFPQNSWYLELNSHIQITRDFIVEPVIQYVVNPDTNLNPKVKHAKSGFVLGLTAVIGIGSMLGLGS